MRTSVAAMTYLEVLDSAWRDHLAPRAEDAPTVISLFAGCGGSSLGYSMAGYRELLAVEWDANAVETFRLNFPDVPVHHGDIATLNVEECLSLTGIAPGELDVLDGSPPCQGFSTAGKREMSDDRNQLFHEFTRLLSGLQPRAFVMENVSGMVKGKMRLIFVEILRELKSCGYRVSARLLNAMYFGVPQSRQRLIFVGVREDLSGKAGHPGAATRPIPAGVAVAGSDTTGTPPMDDKYGRLWPHVKPGQNASDIIGNGFQDCLVLRADRPSPTLPRVQTGRGFATLAHWAEPRGLSVGEGKRLGAFPDAFCLTGDYSAQWSLIGNSVPPLFMRAIAQHVRSLAVA